MNRFAALACILSASLSLTAQTPAPDRTSFASKSHAAYYSLSAAGVDSFACQVRIDWKTIPANMSRNIANSPSTSLISLRANVPGTGDISVQPDIPSSVDSIDRSLFAPVLNMYQGIVTGFLQTWATSGFDGPLPWSKSGWTLTPVSDGYQVHLTSPDVLLTTTMDYRVTRILSTSPAETIEEHPVFTPSSRGFLLTGNDAHIQSTSASIHVRYDATYQSVDGVQLLHDIHLITSDGIDTRFSFEDCAVKKHAVITVKPH